MKFKWMCFLACISILAASSTAQVYSRKFKNQLMELVEALAADGSRADSLRTSETQWAKWYGADPQVDGLTNLEREEIGDANPMCHTITFRKRLQALNNVAVNCMRDVVFDDCCQPLFLALRTSGIYPIEHGRKGYAYCDMEKDGGGWLVVARRAGGKRDFNKTWRRYKKGFGPLDKDFWIGLDAMYLLTLVSTELRFDMRHKNGSWYHAYYNHISVGPETDNYRLTVRGYDPERSTIYDSFSTVDGQPFSTKDNANVDFLRPECSYRLNRTGAGWWWRPTIPCYRTNLNRPYHVVYNSQGDTFPLGIGWCNANSTHYTEWCPVFQFIEMKVRPKQWHCGNRPRIAWEAVQHQFLYRDDEDKENEENMSVNATTTEEEVVNATTSTAAPPEEFDTTTNNKHQPIMVPTTSQPAPDHTDKDPAVAVFTTPEAATEKDPATSATPEVATDDSEEGGSAVDSISTAVPTPNT